MGFCYTDTGLLCCDICGRHGGVRKIRCPFGWCGPCAACPDCRKDPDKKKYFSAAHHRESGCEREHARFAASEKLRYDLINAGRAVRCSALSVKVGKRDKVHVLFAKKDGSCIGFYMSAETYHAFPLAEPKTPEDYRRHGKLTKAPAEFHFGGTTKRAA